jgi:hypothetical protein
MTKYTFIFCMVILAILTALFYLADKGNPTALVITTILVTVLLITLGAGGVGLFVYLCDKAESLRFRANAIEDITIMREMQSLQNQQNKTIMQQLGGVARLPQTDKPSESLLIEDGIFSELD